MSRHLEIEMEAESFDKGSQHRLTGDDEEHVGSSRHEAAFSPPVVADHFIKHRPLHNKVTTKVGPHTNHEKQQQRVYDDDNANVPQNQRTWAHLDDVSSAATRDVAASSWPQPPEDAQWIPSAEPPPPRQSGTASTTARLLPHEPRTVLQQEGAHHEDSSFDNCHHHNNNHNDGDENDILSPLEGILQQNSTVTVRWTMTAAALLLAVSAFLTVLVASHYRFLLACTWVVLLGFFVSLAWLIQQTVLSSSSSSRRDRVFHPAVHAVADWVLQEMQAFVEDCREEYRTLRIANEAAYDSYRETGGATEAVPETKRPRSKLFRAVVLPLLRFNFRRGRRKRRHKETKMAQPQSDASSYVPPSETKNQETELV